MPDHVHTVKVGGKTVRTGPEIIVKAKPKPKDDGRDYRNGKRGGKASTHLKRMKP